MKLDEDKMLVLENTRDALEAVSQAAGEVLAVSDGLGSPLHRRVELAAVKVQERFDAMTAEFQDMIDSLRELADED